MLSGVIYLMIEVFPVVLCHKSEESQEGPAKSVKTCVAIVWVPTRFQTLKPIRALSALRKQQRIFNNNGFQKV